MKIETTMFVGVDVHKYSHTAVAIDCFNREICTNTFDNETIETFLTNLNQHATGKNVVFGLEDTNGNGYTLSRYLVHKGYDVYNVPAIMTDRQRLKTTHRNKSDYQDAKGVAKVTLLSHWTLPQVILTHDSETAKHLSGILNDREYLTKNKTRIKNTLHLLLHQLLGKDYAKCKVKTKFSKEWITCIQLKLAPLNCLQKIRVNFLFDQLTDIQTNLMQIDKLIDDITKNSDDIKRLTEINGCGTLTACKIIAEIGDIKRFKNESKLARYAGLAPRESSSSSSKRRYTDKSGNRKLNRAIHTVALSQIGNRGNTLSKEYYIKKQNEGKSKLHSLRCLKRKLTKEIFTKLAGSV